MRSAPAHLVLPVFLALLVPGIGAAAQSAWAADAPAINSAPTSRAEKPMLLEPPARGEKRWRAIESIRFDNLSGDGDSGGYGTHTLWAFQTGKDRWTIAVFSAADDTTLIISCNTSGDVSSRIETKADDCWLLWNTLNQQPEDVRWEIETFLLTTTEQRRQLPHCFELQGNVTVVIKRRLPYKVMIEDLITKREVPLRRSRFERQLGQAVVACAEAASARLKMPWELVDRFDRQLEPKVGQVQYLCVLLAAPVPPFIQLRRDGRENLQRRIAELERETAGGGIKGWWAKKELEFERKDLVEINRKLEGKGHAACSGSISWQWSDGRAPWWGPLLSGSSS